MSQRRPHSARPKKGFTFKDKEQLYEDCLHLKQKLNQTDSENMRLKVHINQYDEKAHKYGWRSSRNISARTFNRTGDLSRQDEISSNQIHFGRSFGDDSVGGMPSNQRTPVKDLPVDFHQLIDNNVSIFQTERTKDRQIETLKQQNQQLKRQLKNIREKGHSPSKSFVSINLNTEELLSYQLNKLKYQLKKLEQKEKATSNQNKSLEERGQNIRKELDAYKSAFQESQRQIKLLQGQFQNSRQNLSHLISELERLKQEKHLLQQKLKDQLIQSNQLQEKLKNQTNSISLENKKLAAQNQQLREKLISQARQQREEAQRKQSRFNQVQTELMLKIKQQQLQIKKLEGQLERQMELDSKQQQLVLKNLRAEIEQLKEQPKDKCEIENRQKVQLEAKVSDLQLQIEQLNKQLENKKAQNSSESNIVPPPIDDIPQKQASARKEHNQEELKGNIAHSDSLDSKSNKGEKKDEATQLSQIKDLVRYRLKYHRYSYDSLKQDIARGRWKSADKDYVLQRLKKQPFMLNSNQADLLVEDWYKDEPKGVDLPQLQRKMIRSVMQYFTEAEAQRDFKQLELEWHSSRKNFVIQLKKALQELNLSHLFTISRENLGKTLTQMGFSQRFIESAIVDMSSYSQDLEHLEFLVFLELAGTDDIDI